MRFRAPLLFGIMLATGLAGCRGSEPGGGVQATRPGPMEIVMTESDRETADRLVRDWRWNNRLLVVRSGRDSDLSRQASLVRPWEEDWNDRQMRLVLLTADGGLVVDRFVEGVADGERLTAGVKSILVDRYRMDPADPGIEAALVGKDGGVKERWAEVVEPSVIFDLVDAMPMRMREVRESQE